MATEAPDRDLFKKNAERRRVGKLLICTTFPGREKKSQLQGMIKRDFIFLPNNKPPPKNTNRVVVITDVDTEPDVSHSRMGRVHSLRLGETEAGLLMENYNIYFQSVDNQKAVFEYLNNYDISETNWYDRPSSTPH